MGGIILLVGATLSAGALMPELYSSEGRAGFPQLPREGSPSSYRGDQLQVWREVHTMR